MSDVKINYAEFHSKDMEAANGVICHEIQSFPGGRWFHFLEPGGNELGVWSGANTDGLKIE